VEYATSPPTASGWAFPVYQRALGIDYPLKTFDIDFALEKSSSYPTFDLDESLRTMGCLPLDDHQTGLRKYTWAGFEVEFLVGPSTSGGCGGRIEGQHKDPEADPAVV